MTEKSYDIVMSTPIGKRKGTLILNITGNIFTGIMHILGSNNNIKGSLNNDGTCLFSGSFATRFHSYNYKGDGLIMTDSILLNLVVFNRTYVVTGTQNSI